LARDVLEQWFGRYQPDPVLLDQEVERHFADVAPPSRPRDRMPSLFGS